MKSLIALCMLALSACASTTVPKTSNNNPDAGVIRVIGTGPNKEAAKNNGFITAIEIAVGSVILTDKESVNSQLVRDDILKHSSGYVDDYKIINESTNFKGISLVMDVTVKSSKIAERVLNRGKSAGSIEGEKLSTQYKSYSNSKATGDKVLSTVLNDYPARAFDITQGKVDFKLDNNRNPIIEIPYTLKWNHKYLTALNEALRITSDPYENNTAQERIFVTSKDPNAWLLGKTDRYYFNDKISASLVKRHIVGNTSIHMRLLDKSGMKVLEGCAKTFSFSGVNHANPTLIDGSKMIDEVMVVAFTTPKMVQKVNHIDRVELSVINGHCFSYDLN
jgi:hypothetical protein